MRSVPSPHLKLGFGLFSDMLPSLESLAVNNKQDEGVERAYEAPTVVVVGNLRDLLAGSASRFDDGDTCGPGGNLPGDDC